VEVKVNVINEMKKLRSSTYSDKLTWIDEIVQNCQRAEAQHIYIDIDEYKHTITFSDDGVGCTDPSVLFEKNVTGWDNTTISNENPFGEGFFSTLMAANTIEIESIGFRCVFDVNKMFSENTTDVIDVFTSSKNSGFTITLSNLLPTAYMWEVIYRINNIGKYIKSPKIILNGKKVLYEGMNPQTDKPFVHKFNNDYFKGWIRPYCWENDDYGYSEVSCFAFDRLIKKSTKTNGVYGVVTFKPNAINLRSPDRKEFIFDNKYDSVYELFMQEVKKMYLKIVRQGTDKQIEIFDSYIDKYLSIDDYKKFIKFKFITKDEVAVNESTDTVNTANSVAASIGSNITSVGDMEYDDSDNDIEVSSAISNADYNSTIISSRPNKVINQTGNKIDGRSDFGFYVLTDEVSKFTTFINVAEYYKIPIIEIRNCLERNVIEKNSRFEHISNLVSSIRLECKYKNTKPSNESEIRILKVLNAVMSSLDISVPKNTFIISDIKLRKVLKIKNKLLPITDISALATAYNGKIYLDRNYLYAYNTLDNTSNELTDKDIQFIMLNLETICHELSHALYGNEDNTKEHLTCINVLMQKIINVIFGIKDKPIYI
jgi:hypothetical protein